METPRRQRAATADGETPPPGSAQEAGTHPKPGCGSTAGEATGQRARRRGDSGRADTCSREAPAALCRPGLALHRGREKRAAAQQAGAGSESCPAAAPLSPSPRKAWSPLTPSRPGGATSRGRSREPNTRPRRRVHSGFAQEAPAGSASRARQRRVRKREFVQQKIAERSTYATRMNLKNVTWSKRSLTRNDAQ